MSVMTSSILTPASSSFFAGHNVQGVVNREKTWAVEIMNKMGQKNPASFVRHSQH